MNVSFEGELAQYLIEVAEVWNKTIPEVLVALVREELEAEKETAEIIKERDIESAETVAHKHQTEKSIKPRRNSPILVFSSF